MHRLLRLVVVRAVLQVEGTATEGRRYSGMEVNEGFDKAKVGIEGDK